MRRYVLYYLKLGPIFVGPTYVNSQNIAISLKCNHLIDKIKLVFLPAQVKTPPPVPPPLQYLAQKQAYLRSNFIENLYCKLVR